jgi:peptidoglycan/LPS O-acetylase OafA/YrhL
VSKIVEWGHWPVGALFATWGVALFWVTITKIPSFLRQRPDEVTYYALSESAFSITVLLCAWGIFKRRRWGRSLGIGLCAFAFAAVALVPLLTREFDRGLALMVVLTCSTLVWLFLPGVRAEYSRRDQRA